MKVDGSHEYKTYKESSENSLKTCFYSHRNTPRIRQQLILQNMRGNLKKNDTRPFSLTRNMLEKVSSYNYETDEM